MSSKKPPLSEYQIVRNPIRGSFEVGSRLVRVLHKNVHSLHNFALSFFDEALYKATDRPNVEHGVFTGVSKGYFFYQTIKLVCSQKREIIIIFNLFLYF